MASQRRNCTSCLSPLLATDSFCAVCGAPQDATEASTIAYPAVDVPTQLVVATRGKYEFISELGRGGMGIVYLARDITLDRLDAVKVLSPAMLADQGMVERFRREARTIANLRHESIVKVYGVGRADELHYFIMDFIDGTSLSRVLRHVGRLSIQAAESILYQVGSALSYAHHAQSVVHRDVKPSNIMINRQGRAIVTDFGIAKVSDAQGGGLTRTGMLMGTPEYMSPEQCRVSAVTHHTDQYALGAVIFAALTGSPPFTGPWLRVWAAHQEEETPRIKARRPDCPDKLAETVERMLAKVPADRWPDIKDALRHLNLRPLATDEPAIVELAQLVREATEVDAAAPTPLVASRTPTNLRIESPVEEVETGDVLQLHASLFSPDGAQLEGFGLTWESTDPSIVSVDPVTGRLVALAAGSVEISARRGGLRSTLPIGVVPPRVARIEIEPQGVAVEVGQSFQLRAQARDKRGGTISRPITWSSSDPARLRVTDAGSVRGLQPGQGQIVAHCDGAAASTVVSVVTGELTPVGRTETAGGQGAPVSGGQPAPVERIRIARPPQRIQVSEVFKLTATVIGRDGETIDREPIWRVDDPSVVEELGRGRFLALSSGECGVTAEVDGVGQTVPVRVSGSPERPALWRQPAVIAGLVALVGLGAAGALFGPGLLAPPPVTPPVDGGGELPDVASLAIVDATTRAPLAGGVELELGEAFGLAAEASAADGSPIDRSVEWTSTDPAVASVDALGTVTALAEGAVQVSASVGDVLRSILVTVAAPPPVSLAIFLADGRRAGDMTLYVGESITLRAGAEGGNGATRDGPVRWQVRNPEIATVSSNGTVTALRSGATLVEVSSPRGSVANSVLTVRSPPAVPVLVLIGPVWANVFVDGQPQGEGLRRYELTLTPGTHEVRAENPRYPTYTTSVTIPMRAQSFTVDIDLE